MAGRGAVIAPALAVVIDGAVTATRRRVDPPRRRRASPSGENVIDPRRTRAWL
jgi:hypothetical protein